MVGLEGSMKSLLAVLLDHPEFYGLLCEWKSICENVVMSGLLMVVCGRIGTEEVYAGISLQVLVCSFQGKSIMNVRCVSQLSHG